MGISDKYKTVRDINPIFVFFRLFHCYGLVDFQCKKKLNCEHQPVIKV